MKHLLLFLFAALLTLSAGAQTRTFTDQLVVDMGGKTGTTAPLTATVYLTADGLAFVLDFKMPRMQVPMKVKFGQLATTGLPTVAYEPTPASVFTLDGRRLEALPARGGIYIVGGRKVVR